MKKLIEGFDLQLLFFMQMFVLCVASLEDSSPAGAIAFLLPGRRGVVSCGRHQDSYKKADRPHGSVFSLSPFRGELSVPPSLGACLVFFDS